MLSFDREASFGMRLNIPASTAVRFEPGEQKKVILVEMGGNKEIHGFNGLTNGKYTDEKVKKRHWKRQNNSNLKVRNNYGRME